ncbi:MAG: SpoIID/LytB domain-containing protein [candidate division WOR-3 bacterium]
MRQLLRLFPGLALLLAGCCYYTPVRKAVLAQGTPPGVPLVRVRLSTGDPVRISGSAGLDVTLNSSLHALGPNETVIIRAGFVALPGRPEQGLQDTFSCKPRTNGRIRIGDREYRGSALAFVASTGELVVVNVLPIEEYLYGVVPCEISAVDQTIAEAVKAQAVVARSFTLARIARRRYQGHDVWDTYLRDQEYQGAGKETELARQAVLATRGQVLVYHGNVAEALYHANCGGRTSNGFQPFLRSVLDAPGRGQKAYCADGPSHSWEVKLGRDSFEAAVSRAAGISRVRIRSITSDRDPESNRVRYLRFATDKGEVKLTGADFRTALGLKSQNIELRLDRTAVTISGRGHGHGFGMCQDGAVGMARAGATFRQILMHYYSEVELRQLY